MKKKSLCVLFIVLASVLWGIIGIFVNNLSALGFSRIQIVLIRSSFGLITITPVLLCSKKHYFRLHLCDLWIFLGTGVVAMFLCNICYFNAMRLLGSLSVAAVLMYTAPAFVLVLSAILFHEKITVPKLISLVLMLTGCVFVSGVIGGNVSFSAPGLLLGVLSGLGYGLYSIFSRFALQRGYHPLTINFYSFLIMALSCVPFADVRGMIAIWRGETWLWALGIGFICFVLPYLFYTVGLTGIENGKASILSTLEPLVATLVSVFVYQEQFSLWIGFGIALMFGGIGVMSFHRKKAN